MALPVTEHPAISLFATDPWPIMQALGLRRAQGRWDCPFCTSSSGRTALGCKDGGIKCFRCGFKGGMMRLIMSACKCNYAEACRIAEGAYGLANTHPATVQAVRVRLQSNRPKKKDKPAYQDLDMAIGACYIQGSETKRWWYNERFVVVRWDGKTGKYVRPFYRGDDGLWRSEKCPEPWPLMPWTGAGLLCVTEGEKACDAARSIGLTATCFPFGSGNAMKTDWSGVVNRPVLVLCDADAAGDKFGEDVVAMLARQGCAARATRIPGQTDSEDIADYVEQHPDAHPTTLARWVEGLWENTTKGGAQ